MVYWQRQEIPNRKVKARLMVLLTSKNKSALLKLSLKKESLKTPTSGVSIETACSVHYLQTDLPQHQNLIN